MKLFLYCFGFTFVVNATCQSFTTREAIMDAIHGINWEVNGISCTLLTMTDATAIIDAIDIKDVTDLSYLFYNCENFNEDISNWDTAHVESMVGMFFRAKKFDKDLSQWNVGNVKNFDFMFMYAEDFNADISKWDVSKAKSLGQMFSYTDSFDRNLCSWDVSNCDKFSKMFEEAEVFDQDLTCWCSKLNSDALIKNFADSGSPIIDKTAWITSRDDTVPKLENCPSPPSPSPSSPSSPSPSPSGSSNNTGTIVGATLGSLLVGVPLILLGFAYFKMGPLTFLFKTSQNMNINENDSTSWFLANNN